MRQQFILGNPHGEENPLELLYYRLNQVQCQDEDLSPRRIEPTDKPSPSLQHKCAMP